MAKATTVKGGFTYIVASRSMVLYVGVTSDLERRIWEHKNKTIRGFTARYNVDRLLYYELFPAIRDAIAREKQLKGWLRQRKLDLISQINPNFLDLLADLFDWAKDCRRARVGGESCRREMLRCRPSGRRSA